MTGQCFYTLIDHFKELRKLVTGSTVHSLTPEFKKACFSYYPTESPYSYGLIAERVSLFSPFV